MRERGGGSLLCPAYYPFSPFPLDQNKFCTLCRAVREKEGWEGGRGEENKVRMRGKPLPSGVVVKPTCIHSRTRESVQCKLDHFSA